jgi:hypothetical protein
MLSGLFDENELKKNYYQMYYKPFSTLKLDCQSRYSTYDIQGLSKDTGLVSDRSTAILIISVVTFIWIFIGAFINFSNKTCLIVIWSVLESAGLIALVGL